MSMAAIYRGRNARPLGTMQLEAHQVMEPESSVSSAHPTQPEPSHNKVSPTALPPHHTPDHRSQQLSTRVAPCDKGLSNIRPAAAALSQDNGLSSSR